MVLYNCEVALANCILALRPEGAPELLLKSTDQHYSRLLIYVVVSMILI